MNCFPCFGSHKSKKSHSKREYGSPPHENVTSTTPDIKKPKGDDPAHVNIADIQAQTFTFRELATATKNFRHECLLGEGGFGRVYKGTLPATGQVVAVKQLDRNGLQGNKEFLVEVLMLSLLHHESLVNLIGYCADGDQRLLVYEFVSGGSLEEHILGNRSDKRPLDWFTRMKIASSVACGLEYLHDKANPPVIYRDLKSSNILLDDDLHPKLSDFGLAKLAGGDKMNPAPSRVMGTYGYSAPEYVSTGHLTLKSDVYSFGVILLELITGRRAIDTTKPNDEQNLVTWAQPLFRDPKRFPEMADPVLGKHFPEKDLNQTVAIAAMCLQEEAAARPLMSDVVTALSFLSMVPPEVIPASLSHATLPSEESNAGESEAETGMVSDDEGSSYEDGKNDCEESYSKSSSKSSKRSRNSNSSRRNSIGSEEGSVCCSQRSRNETETQSSRTAHGGIGNVSSRSKERNEESERRASFGSNCSDSIERSGSRNKSLGLMRSGSAHLDDNNGSMRSHEANGKRLDHVSSRPSDEERLLLR